MSDIIDINVGETIEEVTINVVDNLITVNINKVTGGGGTQTLAETLDLGNTTGGENISISNGDAIILDNGSMLKKGTIDAGNGGAKGISQICGVGYEHKWEAGRLYIMNDGGTIIREVSHNLTYTPTATDDVTKGFVQNTRWILDNGDVYVCSDPTEDAAVWGLVNTGITPTLQQVTDAGNETTNFIKAYQLVTQTNGSTKSMTLSSSNVDTERTAEWQNKDYTGIADISDIIPQVNSDWNATSGVAEILNKPTIPSSATFVPYTGATANVDLGTHKLLAKDLDINHTSGSGDAATITKGGSGEALKVVKTSGSGNAASITGGITLVEELHLTTDLADAYIASASTWNAKQNALSYTPYKFVQTSQTAHTGTVAETVIATATINGNTFNSSDVIKLLFKATKPNTAQITMRLKINTTNTLVGATQIGLYNFTVLANTYVLMTRTFDLNGGNLFGYNFSSSLVSDVFNTNTVGTSTAYNTANTLYLFFTLQSATVLDTVIPNLCNITN